jgi:hypothetical protein
MKKGLSMEDMPGPFFYGAFYRRNYERSLLQPTAGIGIPGNGSLSALFSYRVDQILNGAEHCQSQDSKD